MQLREILGVWFPHPANLPPEDEAARVTKARTATLDRMFVHRRYKDRTMPWWDIADGIRADVGPTWFATYAPRYLREIWEGGRDGRGKGMADHHPHDG